MNDRHIQSQKNLKMNFIVSNMFSIDCTLIWETILTYVIKSKKVRTFLLRNVCKLYKIYQ